MDVLGTVINCVLVVLTFAVVWFAWQTVREGRKATTAARDTVTAVGNLLAVTQETTNGCARHGYRCGEAAGGGPGDRGVISGLGGSGPPDGRDRAGSAAG